MTQKPSTPCLPPNAAKTLPEQCQLHASCVSIGGRGVLLLGDSGSGKSDLALRLIDGGAELVADDRVDVRLKPSPCRGEDWEGGGSTMELPRTSPLPNPPPDRGRELIATPPERLRGLLEMRGIGIVQLPFASEATLSLAIRLIAREAVERMPEPSFFDCLGARLPLHSLHAFDLSICAKIRQLLRQEP